MTAQPLSIPVFKNDRASKVVAKSIRTAYRLVLDIVKCAKQKRPRKAALLCSKLVNSDVLELLPQTKIFTNIVGYHTCSGKFKKNSYKVLLRTVGKSLSELERHLKSSAFLFEATTKATNALVKKKEKHAYSFNALDDLEHIKQLVIERKEEKVETIVKSALKASKKQKLKIIQKSGSDKKKKAKPADSDVDSDYDTIEEKKTVSKSISKDDVLILKTLGKEKQEVDIEIGDCVLTKRGVVMLGTHIPALMWKKVSTRLGLQIVARQYITAVYAPMVVSPAELEGEALEPEAVINQANQLLALHNKRISDPDFKLSIIGDPWHTRTSSHWWFLCLPRCVVNHPNFRFGSWSFTKTPSVRTALEAQAV